MQHCSSVHDHLPVPARVAAETKPCLLLLPCSYFPSSHRYEDINETFHSAELSLDIVLCLTMREGDYI